MITIKVKGYKAELLETEQLPTGPINYAKVKFIIDPTDTEWTGAMLTATFLALTPRGAKIAAPAPVGAEGIALVPERILSEKCSSLSVGLMGTWINEGLTSRITTNMVNVGVSVPGAGGADFNENITPADLYEYLEKILAEVNSVLSKIDELEDDVDDLIAGAQTDWDQTDDEAYDFLKNKPDIPEVKAVAITKTGQILNYSYDEILSMWDTGVPMTYEGRIVFSLIKESVRARLLTVTGEKGNYEIIETQFSDNGTYARVTESKLYSFSPLHGIDTADGNPLTISSYKIQLPDYVLASTLATALEDYYTKLETYSKTETYTKSEVDALIGALQEVTIQIVQALPQSGSANVIYFVPKTGSSGDVYDEYMWISNAWEHIGSTDIDLSAYALKSELPTKVSDLTNDAGYITDSSVIYTELYDSHISGDKDKTTKTKTEIAALWAAKVPMCWKGSPVIDVRVVYQVYRFTVAEYVSNAWRLNTYFFYLEDNDTTATAATHGYILDSIEYGRVNPLGAVAANNGRYVTGGQVYDAIQNAASVYISDTEPQDAPVGALWIDTADDTLDVPNGNNLSY